MDGYTRQGSAIASTCVLLNKTTTLQTHTATLTITTFFSTTFLVGQMQPLEHDGELCVLTLNFFFMSPLWFKKKKKKNLLKLSRGGNLLVSVTMVNSRCRTAFLQPLPLFLGCQNRDILNFSKTIHRCQNDLHSKCCGDICPCSPPSMSLVYPLNDPSLPYTFIRHDDHPASLPVPG